MNEQSTYDQAWMRTEKETDANFVGSVFEKLGFEARLCPTCKAHLSQGICLNGCHLGKDVQDKMKMIMQRIAKIDYITDIAQQKVDEQEKHKHKKNKTVD